EARHLRYHELGPGGRLNHRVPSLCRVGWPVYDAGIGSVSNRLPDRDAGPVHLLDGSISVSRVHIDRADGRQHHLGLESLPSRRERGRADAVVGGQAPDDDALDTGGPEDAGKPGAVEAGVRIDLGIGALADDEVSHGVDVWMDG